MSNNDIKIHSPKIMLQQKAEKSNRHIDDTEYIPEPYKKIARGMEEQFSNFMLKEMEKSIGGKATGTAESYYKDLQRNKRSEQMALENKLGLQRVILDQIYPKQQRTQASYEAYQKLSAANFNKKPVEMHTVEKPAEIQMAPKNTTEEIGHD